jgi:hypothetical protein
MITIKEAVTDSTARFSHAIAGVLYYNLHVNDDVYQFSVDMNNRDDVGTTTFDNEYRGITLMRYIRKAIDSGNLVKMNS